MAKEIKYNLEGQIAIVTGGGSGIGSGIAKSLCKAGATVIIDYPFEKSKAEADGVKSEIEAEGGKAVTFQADVSKENEVQALFDYAKKEFGRLDILINNAGLQRDALLHEMSLEQWNTVISVNLTGQFLCARAAVRMFLEQGVPEFSSSAGKIICISSVHEIIPWAGHVNYAASKGGVMLMMKTIAQSYADEKIRINSIAPGAIKTNINRDAWETKEAEDKLKKLIPYGRVGETDDIGRVAAWLVSDEADYITGSTILVDGGMCLYPGFVGNG